MPRRLLSFRDKRVLITGASSGIGRALALDLAGRGARLGLIARRREELEVLATEIRDSGGEACVAVADIAERAETFAACAALSEALGGIDLLINNAGYGHHRRFLDWEVEDIQRMMQVNYMGAVHATKAVLPGMVERGEGFLVFIASVAGKIAPPDESAYAASKFAMVGLAESLSLEVEEHGIHVLTVCPGAIRTPFFDAEALTRMPAVAKNTMVPVQGLVDAIVRGLQRGAHEITHPRFIRAGYVVRALAPSFMRTQVRRTTKRPD
ncbi:MAG: SDR family NAD(P)-dependent oxidoreductase [Deltaproteobacteria bacterium]